MDDAELFDDHTLLPDPVFRPLRQTPRLASVESLEPESIWPGLEDLGFIDGGGHTSDSGSPTPSPRSVTVNQGSDVLQFFDPLNDDASRKKNDITPNISNVRLLAGLDNNLQDAVAVCAGNESVVNSHMERPRCSSDSCYTAGYIFEAACQIHRAQQYEANAHYEGAFTAYKSAIAVLLSGALGDIDTTRRQLVKDKTAKYLMRAEYIYNSYLAPLTNATKWGGSLSRPGSELANYKVLGVLGRCMVVVDITESSESQECYILKVIYKSSSPVHPSADIIVPQDVPYMASLLRYHETENAIFLLLQHISGGKLWEHLGTYISTGNTGGRGATGKQQNLNFVQKSLAEPADVKFNDTNDKLAVDAISLVKENIPPQATNLSETVEDVNMNPTDECVCFFKDKKRMTRARFSWAGLDTAELVQNAQKLLQSVSATLQRSEKVLARSEKPSTVKYVARESTKGAIAKCSSAEENEEAREHRLSRNTARSKSSIGHLAHSKGRIIERRYSCEDLLDRRGKLEDETSRRGCRGENALGFGLRRLPESIVRVWASQIVTALEVLHTYGLIFGDLRPDNVLFSSGGCAVLTFIGQWSGVDTVLNCEAIDNLHAAPEVKGIAPITAAADWWSLGALLYELITGKSLVSCHPGGIFSHTLLYLPDWISPEARSLLSELLKPDPYERLGSGSHGMENLKSHPFFSGVKWAAVRAAGLSNIIP